MLSERVDLPAWGLAFLGMLVLGLFVGIRIFGPGYVAVSFGEDPADYDSLKEALRTRGVPFIITESELWIPQRELDRLRVGPSASVDVLTLAERLEEVSEPSSTKAVETAL